MSRYLKLILVLLLVVVAVGAQDNRNNTMPAAEDNTDKPLVGGWWYEFNLRLISPGMYNHRNWSTVISILQDIASGIQIRSQETGTGLWTSGWQEGTSSAAVDSLRSAASTFISRFPTSTEVYSMVLGGSGDYYVGSGGDIHTPSDASFYGNSDFYVSNTHSYNYYAGRTSSSADDALSSQLELTSHGQKYVINMYATTTPLVLDLNGDDKLDVPGGQVLPSSVSKNAKLVPFDMTGDGFEELVEWIGPSDGLLLVYKAGQPVNGNDLFGSAGGYCHGYEKLSVLDVNKDGVLTDSELATLSVWQDKNGNAIADSGEVKSVKELGITSISVNHSRLVSSFVQNGQTRKVWDWSPVTILVKRKR